VVNNEFDEIAAQAWQASKSENERLIESLNAAITEASERHGIAEEHEILNITRFSDALAEVYLVTIAVALRCDDCSEIHRTSAKSICMKRDGRYVALEPEVVMDQMEDAQPGSAIAIKLSFGSKKKRAKKKKKREGGEGEEARG
jgi:hypothetical protein